MVALRWYELVIYKDGKVLWDKVLYCDIKEDEISTYQLGTNDILFARPGGW